LDSSEKRSFEFHFGVAVTQLQQLLEKEELDRIGPLTKTSGYESLTRSLRGEVLQCLGTFSEGV